MVSLCLLNSVLCQVQAENPLESSSSTSTDSQAQPVFETPAKLPEPVQIQVNIVTQPAVQATDNNIYKAPLIANSKSDRLSSYVTVEHVNSSALQVVDIAKKTSLAKSSIVKLAAQNADNSPLIPQNFELAHIVKRISEYGNYDLKKQTDPLTKGSFMVGKLNLYEKDQSILRMDSLSEKLLRFIRLLYLKDSKDQTLLLVNCRRNTTIFGNSRNIKILSRM